MDKSLLEEISLQNKMARERYINAVLSKDIDEIKKAAYEYGKTDRRCYETIKQLMTEAGL